MLMPRKVRYRKQQRGRMSGKAKGGSEVTFGDFGIQAMEPAWLTAWSFLEPGYSKTAEGAGTGCSPKG